MNDEGQNAAWRNRRKRIVAREVSPDTIVQTSPAPVVARPTATVPPPPADPLIVDPTQYVGIRKRREGSHLKYRLTQACIIASLGTAATGIAMMLTDESLVAQILGGSALVLAVVAVQLVRMSRLSYRLRGYAAAAGVLAVLALTASFLPSPFSDAGKGVDHSSSPVNP